MHPVSENLHHGIDILIHCALYKSDNALISGKVNYEGTKV